LDHLDDDVAAIGIELDPAEIESLERHCIPHAMSFSG
jgi:hypothetical protein